MKRVLALLLLMGAVFGLLGQQTAAAAAVIPASAPTAGMSADCMEMMAEHPAKPEKKPCEGLTLDCIFATGCAVPLMRDLGTLLAPAAAAAPELFWPSTAELSGTDRAPETHPPTYLS